ncbi:MAG: purine-binding chemotaxis protein CheW [Candidatus Eisenbacteria bacterium]|nr:purine-binding chemotaxis protein CheW [Candidatus Eisenbacteria bacterium]
MNQRDSSTAPRQLVSFRLGEEEYAIDILSVQEIIRVARVTPVPNAPPFVVGVLNLRGKVIPVVSLRTRLGMAHADLTSRTRILVADLPPHTIGFRVDSVSEVIRVPLEQIEPPPDTGPRGRPEPYVQGVAKLENRLIMILDLQRLLTEEESQSLAA